MALQKSIDAEIKAVGYAAALDRVHTLTAGYLEQTCIKNGVAVPKDKNGNPEINRMVKALKDHYIAAKKIESEMGQTMIKQLSGLLQEYNNVRNNKTFAHANDLINEDEAEFLIKGMVNVIGFIHKIDNKGGGS